MSWYAKAWRQRAGHKHRMDLPGGRAGLRPGVPTCRPEPAAAGTVTRVTDAPAATAPAMDASQGPDAACESSHGAKPGAGSTADDVMLMLRPGCMFAQSCRCCDADAAPWMHVCPKLQMPTPWGCCGRRQRGWCLLPGSHRCHGECRCRRVAAGRTRCCCTSA